MIQRLALASDWVWAELPDRAWRRSTLLGAALADGAYLRTYEAGALAPPAALIIGLSLGAKHPHETYTYTLWLLIILAGLAGLGAALGFWAWVGYCLGDLLLFDRTHFDLFTGSALRLYVAIFISYVLLASLLVVAPLAATAVRFRTTPKLTARSRHAVQLSFLLHACVQATLVYLWAHATAYLIRPLWSYQGLDPDTLAIAPLQTNAVELGLCTAAAVGIRGFMTTRARPHRPMAAKKDGRVQEPARIAQLSRSVRIPSAAVFITIIISGLLSSWAEAIVVACVIASILVLREVVVPTLPGWPEFIGRIPLAMRAILAAVITYSIAWLFLAPDVESGAESFRPLVEAVLLTMLVASLLLPSMGDDSRSSP